MYYSTVCHMWIHSEMWEKFHDKVITVDKKQKTEEWGKRKISLGCSFFVLKNMVR